MLHLVGHVWQAKVRVTHVDMAVSPEEPVDIPSIPVDRLAVEPLSLALCTLTLSLH